MSITYPTTLDTLTNPVSTDTLASPSHADQHSNINDIVEALETKVGVDSSAVTTSLDYKIGVLEDAQPTGTVVGTSDTQTLTNKTLSTGSVIDTNVTVIEVLKKVYPVGCIYTSITATNPATVFGFGTWTAFGSGKTLVGLDSEDGDFDTSEETGGEKTHTLTTAEMPEHTHTQNSHNHTQNQHRHTPAGDSSQNRFVVSRNTPDNQAADSGSSGSYWDGNGTANAYTSYATATNNPATATNQNTGGGDAHNNLPPYIVVYFFKRTA